MPRFETPEPIIASIEMAAGSVRVRASARSDTVVEVLPRNDNSDSDVQAAAQARVEYADGRLLVALPRSRLRTLVGPGPGPAVSVTIDLPEGSELDGSSWADYACEGRLGPVTINSALGDVRVEHSGRLRARSSMGDITVGRVDGHADLHTSTGEIRVGTLDGAGVVKTSSGDLSIGEVTGHLRLKTASGAITVERAHTSVEAKTSAGAVRINEVGGGSVLIESGFGEIEVGVPATVAAWLDMRSKGGIVRSELDAVEAPAAADRTVEVHAHTGYGDILVRRA